MADNSVLDHTILAVFPAAEDRISLAQILGRAPWNLRFTRTFEEARDALRALSFGVVISEARLTDRRCWKDLLREIEDRSDPPPLIVADRLAGEGLWAEVLNLGGYDVLMKPFDAKEVLHAVSMAFGIRRNERQHEAVPRKPPASVEQESMPGRKTRAASGNRS